MIFQTFINTYPLGFSLIMVVRKYVDAYPLGFPFTTVVRKCLRACVWYFSAPLLFYLSLFLQFVFTYAHPVGFGAKQFVSMISCQGDFIFRLAFVSAYAGFVFPGSHARFVSSFIAYDYFSANK